MTNFESILSRPTIFKNRDVLSPHYLPNELPHREREIEIIMKALSPALRGEKPRNIFIYGKTGTGNTSSVKYVMDRFAEMKSESAKSSYLNCRIYNSRYRIFQKIIKDHLPQHAKSGVGLSFLYEKLIEWINDGRHLIIVLDEIDMVKDLDDLVYTLTRSNDELRKGGVALLGISNKLSFKERLDPRSRSTLFENEMVFPPYTSEQLQSILKRRIALGFSDGAVDDSAINIAAAVAAQDNGDARYALKLLLRAGEIADEKNESKILDRHVEEARRCVDEDISVEAINTLPQHQQIVLYAISLLSSDGGRYSKLIENPEHYVLSGEVYEKYASFAREFNKEPRSARWYREYLCELGVLGLINMVESGKGMRGHSRLIKLVYPAERVKGIVEKNLISES